MLHRASFETIFPCCKEDAWDCLVFSKGLENYSHEEETTGTASLIEGKRFIGFQTAPLEPDLKPIEFYVTSMEKYAFISFNSKAEQACIPYDINLFPFTSFDMSYSFENHPQGTLVTTRLNMIPRGLRGWFLCIIALRQSRSKAINLFKDITVYLRNENPVDP